jgi:hypothetical protein
MAYKPFSGQTPIKSGEQITMEEFHEDFKIFNNILILGDKRLLQSYTEILRNKWIILTNDTPFEEELKKLDEIAKTKDNPFALCKGIVNILRRAGWEAGFYGKIFVGGKNPGNETERA